MIENMPHRNSNVKETIVSTNFRWTTAVAEVFGLAIRFVNKDHIISHRALSIRFYRETFRKEHLAYEIVKIISTQHGIDLNRVLFAVCDGCPTNGAALTTINQLQPCLLGLICISHAANVVGSVLKSECQIAEFLIQGIRPFLVGMVKYEFSKTKKHFLVFENSYFVFFAYQTYRSSVRIRVYFEFSTWGCCHSFLCPAGAQKLCSV